MEGIEKELHALKVDKVRLRAVRANAHEGKICDAYESPNESRDLQVGALSDFSCCPRGGARYFGPHARKFCSHCLLRVPTPTYLCLFGCNMFLCSHLPVTFMRINTDSKTGKRHESCLSMTMRANSCRMVCLSI